MLGGTPVLVLKEGSEREKGKTAFENNVAAAKAIADTVKTTLGPKGMDKMLVDSTGDITITNDGVTILKEMEIEHPTAKMLVEVAKTQDQQCGDGTTTAVVIAGELLKKSEELVSQNIHPTIITKGFHLAEEFSLKEINSISIPVSEKDYDKLKKIAITTMNSKGVGNSRELFADIAVKAVTSVMEQKGDRKVIDMDSIQIEKKIGGSMENSELINGVIIDKERAHPRMPKVVKEAKIALIASALEIKKTEIDAKIEINDPTKIQSFMNAEEAILQDIVKRIVDLKANVVFCQKGVDDFVSYSLAKNNIMVIKQVKESDMKKLAKAVGGKIVTGIRNISQEDLGSAGVVEETKIGDSNMVFVKECSNPKAVSILIRGGTEHVIEEAERSLHDALRVVGVALEDGYYVPGGGAIEMYLATKLRKYAPSVGGREQMAIEAFADAMEIIPRTLSQNAGLDAMDTLIKLRKVHNEGGKEYFGINLLTGNPENMIESNIIEPMRVKKQAIQSATEAATMIIRIDDVITAKKSSGGGGNPGMGGMGGMGGGMEGYGGY
jgi:thermosome